jgi:hypothetical protein
MTTSEPYAPDEWTPVGPKINDSAQLARIRQELEQRGAILLKHWHYCGARSPSHVAFDEFEDFMSYMTHNAHPGDAFDVWPVSVLCSGIGTLAAGKYPDAQGCIPKRGAY